jgi:hypothetical protein
MRLALKFFIQNERYLVHVTLPYAYMLARAIATLALYIKWTVIAPSRKLRSYISS